MHSEFLINNQRLVLPQDKMKLRIGLVFSRDAKTRTRKVLVSRYRGHLSSSLSLKNFSKFNFSISVVVQIFWIFLQDSLKNNDTENKHINKFRILQILNTVCSSITKYYKKNERKTFIHKREFTGDVYSHYNGASNKSSQ